MKQLNIPVGEFTTPSPWTVTGKTSLREAEKIMVEHGFRHLPVVEDDIAVGLLSRRDIQWMGQRVNLSHHSVEEAMTPGPYAVKESARLVDVVTTMSRRKIGSAIVVDSQRRVRGIFTVTDALHALIEILQGEWEPNSDPFEQNSVIYSGPNHNAPRCQDRED